MRRGMIMVSLLCTVMASATVFADGPDSIIGVWNTEEGDGKIEIYVCGNSYCGRIIWLKESTYPADSKEGIPGTPVLDTNNPDPSLRKRPILGQQLLYGFKYVGNDRWDGGKIYDSDNGKTYNGKMELLSQNQLKIRGFIGISLFGGSTVWTKDQGQDDREH